MVTIFTSLGWIASVREGLRGVMEEGPLQRNALLQKLVDAGTLLLLGVILVVSAGASLVFGTAADWFFELLRWMRRWPVPLPQWSRSLFRCC